MKNKLQDSSQEVVEGVENGANYFSNKAKSRKMLEKLSTISKSCKSNEMELVKINE